MNAIIFKPGQQVCRILPEHLSVAVTVGASHHLLGLQHILRLAGVGIIGQFGQHAAYHGTGDDLMADLGGQSRGHELMVHSLENDLLKILARKTVFNKAAGGVRMAEHRIHFIKRQPVFYLVLITRADGLHKSGKQTDNFPGIPAIVLENQI